MTRRSNLELDEDEFQRVKRLIVGKANRYHLVKVEVSDRLVIKFVPEEVNRLVAEVAEAGFELTFKNQAGYSVDIAARRKANEVPRFGAEPRSDGVRHPKTVHWAILSRRQDGDPDD